MNMTPVFNANGDKILACECDLDYYESIGWTTEQVAEEDVPEAELEETVEEIE